MEFEAVIPLGKINLNNRLYTKDSFLATNYNVPVFLDYKEDRAYEDIIGRAKINITDNAVELIININKYEDILINGNLKPVFCCNHAQVDADGKISDADITEIFYTSEPAITDISFEVIERTIESADICDYCRHFYDDSSACYKCMLQEGTEDMFDGVKVKRLDI